MKATHQTTEGKLMATMNISHIVTADDLEIAAAECLILQHPVIDAAEIKQRLRAMLRRGGGDLFESWANNLPEYAAQYEQGKKLARKYFPTFYTTEA